MTPNVIRDRLMTAALKAKVRTDDVAQVVDCADQFDVDADRVTVRHRASGLDVESWLAGEAPTRWPGAVVQPPPAAVPEINPFMQHTANLSRAGQLAKTEPAKALALARAAGFADVGAAVRAMADASSRSGR